LPEGCCQPDVHLDRRYMIRPRLNSAPMDPMRREAGRREWKRIDNTVACIFYKRMAQTWRLRVSAGPPQPGIRNTWRVPTAARDRGGGWGSRRRLGAALGAPSSASSSFPLPPPPPAKHAPSTSPLISHLPAISICTLHTSPDSASTSSHTHRLRPPGAAPSPQLDPPTCR
jgi:hypothetical protein